PLLVPSSSAHGSIFNEAAIIRHLTGGKVKAVPGFQGGARTLAVISGEVDGMLGTLDGMMSVLDLPGTRILLRLSSSPIEPGTPGVPKEGVPALHDVAQGPDTGPLVQLMDSYAQLGRMMALPPGTPAPIVEQWRQRFADVIADPEFRKQAAALRVGL